MDPAPSSSPPAPRRGLSPSVVVPLLLVALLCGVVFVAAATAYVAPGVALPLFVRHLPGFDLSLPPGQRTDGPKNEYRKGWFVAKGPLQRYVVLVAWQHGGSLEGDDHVRTLNILAAPFGGAVAEPHGVQVAVPGHPTEQSWKIALPSGGELWATRVLCGAPRVMISTTGRPPAIERLHRRVAASFVCRADATTDARLADIALAFDRPTGWRRAQGAADLLELTNGPYKLIARTIPARFSDEMMDRFAPSYSAVGIQIGTRDESDWPIEGAGLHGWLTLRYCPDRDETLSVVASCSQEAMDSSWTRAILRDVRCRRPGEAAQVFPVASP